MGLVNLTSDNFSEYANGDKPLVVDFYADWCGPCRTMGPIIEQLAEEREDIVVAKFDVDKGGDLSSKLGVLSIPTILLFNGSEEPAQVGVGVMPLPRLNAKVDEVLGNA
jgi:thioredoxin 1